MIRLENLRKVYRGPEGEVRAVDGVSLETAPGKILVVQGPSGCGKTTLLLMAGGLLRPDAGQVAFNGQDLYLLSPEARARFRAEHIGFVFQQFHLVPYLTVLENVLAPSLARPSADAPRRARELVEHLGLAHRANHVPGELSTGERQRVALARALLNEPQLLLADEPTGNLDSENAKVVLEHLAEFAHRGGAVLLGTHDPKAQDYATETLTMASGRFQSRS